MAVESVARHRQSTRLAGWDYAAAGAYFVTLVTKDRECLFGQVENATVVLTDIGKIVEEEWLRTAEVRAEIDLDAFVVMPNHVHGIVVIGGPNVVGAHGRAPLRPPDRQPGLVRGPRSLGSLVAGFKAACTTRINILRNSAGMPVWQCNYFDRIIRDERELERVRQYVFENPMRWHEDLENPLPTVISVTDVGDEC